MAKLLPKIPKHLSSDYRKRAVTELAEELKILWSEISKSELKSAYSSVGGHGIMNLNQYLTDLENHVYEMQYLHGSLDSYRICLRNLKYNLRHNGKYLLVKFNPEQLTHLSPKELGYNPAADATTPAEIKEDCKEIKDINEVKETKEIKNVKETKEIKDIKDVKETKEIKEMKEAKEIKEMKEAKETKKVTRDIYEISSIIEELEDKLFPEIFGCEQSELATLVTCNKCGPSVRVRTFGKQTRSADEAQTIFAYCPKCKSRWRM